MIAERFTSDIAPDSVQQREASGPKMLWAEVLERALQDLRPKYRTKTKGKSADEHNSKMQEYQNDAKRFFFKGGEHFVWTCDAAGLDAGWVQKLAREKLR